MSAPAASAAWLDGQPAGADALRALALVNYGHFTSMQVRGHAVQGLALHLARLQHGTRELFDAPLDESAVRGWLRAAIAAGGADVSLRATVFAPGFDHRRPDAALTPSMLVTTAPPVQPRTAPLRLKSYRFGRTLPQVKHVGTFPLFHYRRRALRDGCDDALFVDADGRISEGSVWNLGLWDGRCIVWPDAPALRGTAEQLLKAGLGEIGMPQEARAVRLEDLGSFSGAFACNASGVTPVAAIDGAVFGDSGALPPLLARALATQPWQVP